MSGHRRKKGVALALLLALSAGGCDDFLDVNDDPNNPVFVRMEQTLPAVLAGFHRSVLNGDALDWTGQWMEHWSYNRDNYGYSQVHHYELTSIDTQGAWADIYADVAQECVNMMEETAANGDWAYHGIAKFILAWSVTIAADLWGPVPLTEAFDPLNPDPVYDDEETVYATAQQYIAEAIEEMQMSSNRVPGENDLLFGGDMARWVELAHSVQARLHMRLSSAPGEDSNERAQMALTEIAAAVSEDASFFYTGGQGYRSPYYGFSGENWNSSTTASKPFLDRLEALDDPRIPYMFKPSEFDGQIRGHIPANPRNTTGDPFFDDTDRCVAAQTTCETGEEAWNDSIMSKLSWNITSDSLDYVWFSMAELHFLEAEAQLITSGPAAADAAYREGIRAHMERLEVDETEMSDYLESLPSLANEDNPLEALITQKYIALYLDLEPYNDYRRTGYPVVNIVPAPYVPGIPRRLRTPATEVNYNNANVQATGIDQGLDGLMHDVWWASGS